MRTSETAVQNTGKGGFRITGIGTGMLAAISAHKSKQGKTTGNQHHQKGCQTSRNIIGNIIQTGGETAEPTIALVLVADHGIQRVHHLIGKHARNSQQQIPEQGGNYPVTQILCQSLQCSSSYLLRRERRRITAYDARHLFSAFLQRTVYRLEYHAHLANQRSARQAIEYQQYLHRQQHARRKECSQAE